MAYIYIKRTNKQLLQGKEAKIVAGCCRGERSAQQLLYETYRGPLYRMCLRYAHDSQEAEDFLHDGFIKVFQDIQQYRGEGALGAWVRQVVLNTLLQQLRKRRKIVEPAFLPDTQLEDEHDFDELIQPISTQQILSLIGELPKGYGLVFNLFYLEEKSHQQIAELLGISLGASKSQLFKAKRMLRHKIMQAYPNASATIGLALLAYGFLQFMSTSNI